MIKKYLKKLKLLKKYKRTDDKMQEDLWFVQNCPKILVDRYLHDIYCEVRCYNRLLKL